MKEYFQDCLVCNTTLTLSKTHIKNVFSDKNILPSSRSVLETLQDILSRTLDENTVHSRALCRKCYKTCTDYDGYKSKINIIKMDMCEEYNTTINSTILKTPTKPSVPATKPTVVVPASKLLPIPADFQLNFGQLSEAVSKAKAISPFNFKVTLGTTSLTQNSSAVKFTIPNESSVANVKVNNDISKEWDANMALKDIFAMSEDGGQTNDDDGNEGDENDGDCKENLGKNGDEEEHEMEIDEECSMAVVPVSSESQNSFENIKAEPNTLAEYADIISVAESNKDDGNYILGNVKVFNSGDDDDDEHHTIVVNGDNASILEMMSGQKVIYENGGLSLVMAHDDGQNEADDDDDDGQDSNEESQIELQVSGDEETANAIIAAAQEQGGAFIKVESGEMYRVKSVQSTSDSMQDYDVESFVTKHRSKFSCNLCQKLRKENQELLDAGPMMQHLKEAHDAKIYLCPFCGRGMRKRQEYSRHLADHSRKNPTKGGVLKRLHECTICKKCYNSRTLLHEHMNTHTGSRPYRCHLCNKGFASKYTHQAHLKTHQSRPRPHQCGECNKTFLSAQNLKQHEKTHSGVKDFMCKICNKKFRTQHNLEIHGIVHSRERTFVCTFCEKAFLRKTDLADHRRTHTGERPFECELCGAKFAQRSNLHSHRRATHFDDKRHGCPECPKRFKRRRLLEYHIKASHTGERDLKCEVCQATFVYPEHYKKHMKIHTGVKPYMCEICGKSFNSRDNRNTHRFTHSEKKPYECLACGHSYMRKRALIAHMNESGHLAESIVVNQPRVTRVRKENSAVTTIVEMDKTKFTETKINDDKVDNVFHTSGKLESLNEPLIININEADRETLFIEDVTLENEAENALLEAVNATQLEEQATHLGTDENGAVLRLIQVKLPNGTDGWVALND